MFRLKIRLPIKPGEGPKPLSEAEAAKREATRPALWAKCTAERLGIPLEARPPRPPRPSDPSLPIENATPSATGRGGLFELYFPRGIPQLTAPPATTRHGPRGQAWAGFASRGEAERARTSSTAPVAWSRATAARLRLPLDATIPRTPGTSHQPAHWPLPQQQ
ncbi:hypothetical protein PAPYR_1699 [Paratrimastix pyriformis]|uniref:Uncharacterized protein n=1 Tax=Paratrimastix pyriformis TaxID=342808 RepID=A0ABQ8UTY1_9EUKA|nr:hypothetical protein PAPYR_1699 [Paratrimastix pyriformis]